MSECRRDHKSKSPPFIIGTNNKQILTWWVRVLVSTLSLRVRMKSIFVCCLCLFTSKQKFDQQINYIKNQLKHSSKTIYQSPWSHILPFNIWANPLEILPKVNLGKTFTQHHASTSVHVVLRKSYFVIICTWANACENLPKVNLCKILLNISLNSVVLRKS